VSDSGGTDRPGDEPPRTLWQRFAQSPGAQIVVAAVVLAFAFPSRSSGTIGLVIIAGALGVGVAMLWPRLPESLRRPATDISTMLVITVVIAAGVTTFWDALTQSPDWPIGDWGPQHAVLAHIMPSLPGFHAPVWDQALSTGDAPLELYPALAYYVAGHLALLLGLEGDLMHALFILAVIVHIGIAVGTTLLAMRVAPRPLAFIVGLAALVDTGAVAHGGSVGLFHWALLHSALAMAFVTAAAVCVIAAVQKPRLRTSIGIWVFTALACIAHPAGLLSAAVSLVALLAIAILASDVMPRRALAAGGHVVLGVAIGASTWMPLAERIYLYGQHFPNPIRTPERVLEDLLAGPSPVTVFAMLTYAAYFGILAGLWSRRAAPIFMATSALVLLVGLSDAPYMAFDLTGPGVARLGTERLAQLARPFIGACSAYGISVIWRAVIAAWKTAPRRQRLAAAAIVGAMSCIVARQIPSVWWNVAGRARGEAQIWAPDHAGRMGLVAWANQVTPTVTPAHYARAMFETDQHMHMHLTAMTGLPTFHQSWLPDLLLRERIEDATPESLRRFNVRWVVAQNGSPSLGDATTERVFGSFHIRELSDWDGKFARIEKGEGAVNTLELDDNHVTVEVLGREPQLVALGTGFYPRWRATHASGANEPVFALPTIPGGRLRVVSAWLAPGKTTFTIDGPLPSDGKGRPFTLLAIVGGIAVIIAWRITRLRIRILRRVARIRTLALGRAWLAVRIGVPLVVLVLFARGCIQSERPTLALQVGSGMRGTSTVWARPPNGDWRRCGYHRTDGTYLCDNVALVYDAMAATLNDAPPSWGFNTPGILIEPQTSGVEVNITVPAKLVGTYWCAASEGSATLLVDGASESRHITRAVHAFSDTGAEKATIHAQLGNVPSVITCVREETILPPRGFLQQPPDDPPASVLAIH
jgi:hypothetical protein